MDVRSLFRVQTHTSRASLVAQQQCTKTVEIFTASSNLQYQESKKKKKLPIQPSNFLGARRTGALTGIDLNSGSCYGRGHGVGALQGLAAGYSASSGGGGRHDGGRKRMRRGGGTVLDRGMGWKRETCCRLLLRVRRCLLLRLRRLLLLRLLRPRRRRRSNSRGDLRERCSFFRTDSGRDAGNTSTA